MKKLVLTAVLAASLSAPAMAGDVAPRPWAFRINGVKVTSVTPGPILMKLTISGPLNYDEPMYTVPNGVIVNPAITVKWDIPTLNSVKVPRAGFQNFVGATCNIVGSSSNLTGASNVTTEMLINNTHTATTVTCTK